MISLIFKLIRLVFSVFAEGLHSRGHSRCHSRNLSSVTAHDFPPPSSPKTMKLVKEALEAHVAAKASIAAAEDKNDFSENDADPGLKRRHI